MPFNVPNILTLVRIWSIPIFVLAYYVPMFGWNNVVTTVIFTLAAITDWLDGYLARRLNQQSAFGAFLDPVADKLMVAVALVLLVGSHPGALLAIPTAVIIGREITISALREWMANIGEQTKVAVSMIGKIKTTAQMIAIGLLLYREPVGQFPTLETGYVLLYMAAILTLWSMFIYLRAAWPTLRKSEQETS
jgi:CDP-diacylglycerol--glycerol-3-phosphate 3-phosphatidyltransferase